MNDDLDFVEEFGVNPGDPLTQRPGHVSHGRFERVVRSGHFVVTTEIAPPDSVDPDEVLARANLFDGYVDAINATDGSGANCHMSSLGVCAILTRAGYSPIIQFSCRDRNRIAMQGDLLSAAALGVCSVLCLTGDDVGAGDHPEAKPVFDLDSISLLQTTKILRDESRFLSGRQLDTAPRLFVGASINPFVPPLENRVDQLAKKIRAGAEFIQSQYCFDIERLRTFMARACDLGLHEKSYIIIGVGVLGSAQTARWLRANVPGVHIPDAIIKRLEDAPNPKAEGRRIAVDLMQQIKETPGVSGVHLMAYRHEKWVGEIVKASGVLGDRKPWAPEPLDSTIGVVTPNDEMLDNLTSTVS
ncbi:methylenetetrahydrofolate reductase [Maritalea myrionectae]|uniref:methylenetetrahydrofolate reductase n=1 Tax=Maritalea myrionectae TaxID=454601 RepID=UPI0003F99CE8|nr:methylenetetrahydrofolate reductase [Maritalea myrionectae]